MKGLCDQSSPQMGPLSSKGGLTQQVMKPALSQGLFPPQPSHGTVKYSILIPLWIKSEKWPSQPREDNWVAT